MPVNEIKLKIKIDNKEAIASLQLTDDNVQDLYKSFKYGKQEVNGFTTQLSMGFNNAREIIGGVREAYQAVTALFRQPIQAQVELEQAQVSFKVLFGNAELADQRIKELYKFTATTPFQLKEVVTASRQLEVLTQGALSTGAGLRMVGDVASGVRVSINELSMWFGRLYDGIQSGRPVGEALMRLQELGVLSGDVRSEIETLSKAGADNAEVWDVVTEAMSKFNGMMEEQSDTLGGKISNLQDNFTQIQTTIGGTIATVLTPLLGHINSLTSSLNENYPFMIGLVGVTGSLGAALVILNTTGIMPVIKSLILKETVVKAGITSTVKQAAANAGLTASNVTLATSARGAAAGIKSIFTSLGPVGWAIIGITALVEVLGLFASSTDDTTESIKNNANETIELIKREKEHAEQLIKNNVEVDKNRIKVDKLTESLLKQQKVLADADIASYTEKLEDAEFDLANSSNFLFMTLTDKHALINKLMEEFGDDYTSMNERVVEKMTLYSDILTRHRTGEFVQSEENLERIKDEYEAWENVAEEVSAAAKAQADLNAALKRREELTGTKADKDGNKNDEEKLTIQKKINDLKEKEKFLVEEYLNLSPDEAAKKKEHYEKLISDIKNQISSLELGAKIKAEVEVDQSRLSLKNIPTAEESKTKSPTELKPLETADQYQELTDMRLDVMEEGYLKEEAIRNANHQADLAAYRGVVGAKEIIDKYYRKQKEKQDEASAMASIQTSMNALNFIAAAVNQYTVIGKAIAVAQATWNTYQAATAALGAQPWGPWNIALAAMVTAAGLANVEKIISAEPPKMQGFYMGGRFRKGEAGYIEGVHNEIIAPEKTFIEVFERELRPQIYAGAASYSNSNQFDSGAFEEIKKLNANFERYADRPVIINDKAVQKIGKGIKARTAKSRV